MKPVRGFTLLEAMFTVAIMGGLIVILAGVFSTAAAGFKLGNSRLGLQGELRRILAPLRRDLRNASYQSASVAPIAVRVAAAPPGAVPQVDVRRDRLCFNGLKNNGRNNSQYDPDSGKPLWDCYLVYFATADNPNGRLVRAVLDVSPPRLTARVFPNLNGADLSLSNPALAAEGLRVLSKQVLAFDAELDDTTQMVRFGLRLRAEAGRREGKSTAEIMEVQISVRPANTWPRL